MRVHPGLPGQNVNSDAEGYWSSVYVSFVPTTIYNQSEKVLYQKKANNLNIHKPLTPKQPDHNGSSEGLRGSPTCNWNSLFCSSPTQKMMDCAGLLWFFRQKYRKGTLFFWLCYTLGKVTRLKTGHPHTGKETQLLENFTFSWKNAHFSMHASRIERMQRFHNYGKVCEHIMLQKKTHVTAITYYSNETRNVHTPTSSPQPARAPAS